jgi:hypothetical protein
MARRASYILESLLVFNPPLRVVAFLLAPFGAFLICRISILLSSVIVKLNGYTRDKAAMIIDAELVGLWG